MDRKVLLLNTVHKQEHTKLDDSDFKEINRYFLRVLRKYVFVGMAFHVIKIILSFFFWFVATISD